MPFDIQEALAEGHSPADIVRFLANQDPDAVGFDAKGAVSAGWSPEDIVSALRDRATPASAPTPPDTSITSGLRAGLHGAAEGLAATGRVVRDTAGDNLVGQAGGWIADRLHGAVDAPSPSYQPGGPEAWQAIKSADARRFVAALPRAAAEFIPDLAATVGAGAIAGPAGAGSYLAARNAGENVEAVARNNRHDAPTAADVAQGAVATVPQVALGMLGVGRLAPAQRLFAAAPAIARPVVRAATEGVANAAADAVQQAGTSVGTEAGLTVDPDRVGSAFVQGVAARAAHEVPGAIGGTARAGSDAVMSRIVDQPVSTAEASSIVRVGDLLAARKAAEQRTRGGDPSDSNVANSVRTELTNEADALLRTVRRSGTVSEETHGALDTLFDLARRHNKGIGETEGGETATALDRLRRADDLDGDARDKLETVFRDLDTLSRAARDNRQSGPLEQIGRLGGQVGGIVAGAAHYNLPGVIAALAGHSHLAKIGGLAGAAADTVFGTKTPTVLLRAQAARRMLRREGADAGPDTFTTLRDLSANFTARRGSLDAALGLADTPASRLTPADVLAADPADLTLAAHWAGTTTERLRQGAQQGFTPADVRRSVGLTEAAGRTVEGLVVDRAKARQRAAQRDAADLAKGEADDRAALDRAAAKATLTRRQQEAAAVREKQRQDAAAGAKDAALGAVEQQEAAAKAQQEEAMFNANDKAVRTAAQVNARQLAGEVSEQSAAARGAAFKSAQARRAAAVFNASSKATEAATTRNEAAANTVSGMAYRGAAARALRAQGVTGAAAAMPGGAAPDAAFVRSGGRVGTPAAPMVDGAGQPVRVAGQTAAVIQQARQRVRAKAPETRRVQTARAGGQVGDAPPVVPATSALPATPADVPLMLGKGGWAAYVQRAARDQHGVSLHEPDLHQAIDRLVSAGRFSPEQGGALKARETLPLDNPEVASAVLDIAQSALHAKMHGGNPPPHDSTPARAPIRDKARWDAAREDRKEAAETVAKSLETMGLHASAGHVRSMAVSVKGADKAEARDAAVRAAPKPLRGRVKGMIPEALTRGTNG